MPSIIQFIVFQILLAIASAFVITGWFAVTRGYIDEKVDGTRVKTGMLLNGWYHFWMQEKKTIPYQYTKGHLHEFARQLSAYTGLKTIVVSYEQNHLTVGDDFIPFIPLIEKAYDVLINKHVAEKKYQAFIFKMEPQYRFPAWIRKPLAQCITCHSSVYGILIFCTFHLLIGVQGRNVVYGMFENIYMAYIVSMCAHILSLAYLNTVLWKKYNGA